MRANHLRDSRRATDSRRALRAWRVHRYGRPNVALRLDQVERPAPGPGQVRIAVTHAVLNFNDIDGCHGRYRTVNPPLPYIAGMEVVGSVDACGPGAEPWLGRRVMATPVGAHGGYAEHAVADIDMTFEAPGRLSDAEAAAFFFPFHLSYLALHERARIRAGETVLVHAAAGGAGSAAVQLARAAGAVVVTTSGGAEKRAFCAAQGVARAVDYLREDWFEPVMEVTDGVGVDVVFDTVGGEVAQRSFRCIARGGRYLMVGFAGGIEAEDQGQPLRPIMFGNFALLGVLLAYSRAPDDVKRATGFNLVPRSVGDGIHAALNGLLAAGAIRPVVGEVVPFTDLPAALEALEERKTIGRIVVEL